jgi:serine phosphatase RsbU (regulator of sigma subunit)
MQADHPGAIADKSLIRTFVEDIQHALDRMQQVGARRIAGRTLADLDEFYLSEEHRKRLARAGLVRRWILRSWWLFKSLVLSLTPARRALLALGLLNLSAVRISGGGDGGNWSLNLPSFGVALILLVLALELKDKLVAHDELEEGRGVQRALMPSEPPRIPGWDVWLYTQSANEVSGDLVDVIAVDDQRTALVLADVAGKGLSAALLMAKLQATVRALVGECGTLARLGECVNRIMYRDGVRGRFATLVYLEISPHSGRARWLNAGHLSPLILRPFTIEEMPHGAVALGMVPVTPYEEQGADLDVGDTLVVYSDGITEAMNRERDFFGDERLRAALQGLRGWPAADLGRAVVDAVARFVGDAPVHDDVSLVLLRRTT